ncbi:MAG: BatA domain-containing protein [Flavobacteriales bacterium]|nr:BatA domain-containing protein [Flavobacteriales bacterium]
MKFAYPEFLFALFAIAIPIIIHLFNFRKFKKIYFSNVSFLREVKKESQSKSKLKHLLILASRILAITFLVFAFAQPFVPSANLGTNVNNVVGIYIDNSFSMESVGENGSLLSEAKTKAIELVKSYAKTDQFVVCDNKFATGSQRLLTADEAITKIEELEITSETRLLSTVFSRITESLNSTSNDKTSKTIVVLSDLQQSTSDIANIVSDSTIKTYFFPVQTSEKTNLYVDSCWFENPTHLYLQQEKLLVRIKNHSNQDLENIPLKLYINDKLIVPASFSIKANDKTIVTLNYQNHTKGTQAGKIELSDAPVTMDDAFYFSYLIASTIDVLEITEKEALPNIKAIFSTDSLFKFSSYAAEQLDYSAIKRSNLVVLNGLTNISSGLASSIKNFVKNGGSLVVIPAKDIDFESYQSFLSLLQINHFTATDTSNLKVSEVNYTHPLYASVFEGKPEANINLPTVNAHYKLSPGATNYRNNLLLLKNGEAVLTEYKIEKGTVYLSSISFDESAGNFAKHAIFVPTIYNMALLSQLNYPLFYTIGKNDVLTLNHIENEGSLRITTTNFELIPKTKNEMENTTIFVTNGVSKAGNYLLQSATTNLGLAYNYNRLESDLTNYSAEEITDLAISNQLNLAVVESKNASLKSAINELQNGTTYWKICIILALLFLAIEIALIKLFR